jgi:predicted ATPase
MFTEVQIENYKSIQNLKIGLGRVNVFIGENGCGKSNILEAIALAGAAAADKLDNEFLAPRGIRVTEPEFMRSAFDKNNISKDIKIKLKLLKLGSGYDESSFIISHDNRPYSNWKNNSEVSNYFGEDSFNDLVNVRIIKFVQEYIENNNPDFSSDSKLTKESIQELATHIHQQFNDVKWSSVEARNFLIYSPENFSLRVFEEEGQVQPLGTKGQGLLKLLRVLSLNSDKINQIKQRLELIDWFNDFKIHQDSDIERTIQIKDRYLDKELPYFNQRSSNEGFLFLMFYFALFVSDDTPKFFAIDNIENALNPKLCTRLIQELVELAKKYDKQVIFTTHNPAILDGLDLQDDEQRLFTIYRNIYGHTKAERIFAPQPLEGEDPVPLSEAFMNGYIGGLPDNF